MQICSSTVRLTVLFGGLLVLAGACSANHNRTDASAPEVRTSGASSAPAYGSLRERLGAFVQAFNSADDKQMWAFYGDGVTKAFRERGSEQQDSALYRRLRDELGRIEIQGLMRDGPDAVTMLLASSKVDMPVRFEFSVVDERIDGFKVNVGGPPPGGSGLGLKLPPADDLGAFIKALDSELANLTAQDKFSGVALLARKGQPFFHKAYGLADRATGRPNKLDTAFDVGSITKFLTRIAIARLLQEGKLDSSKTIYDYLPDYPDVSIAKKVTVQHLLDHSSGLGDIFNKKWMETPKENIVAPRDFFPFFAGEPLKFEPGSSRAYSNAGFMVLGAIIESVTGMPYAEYIDQNILAPAGVMRSGFLVKDGSNPALAIGYSRSGGEKLAPNIGRLPPKGSPAGSSVHTAADLLMLDQALRSGQLLSPKWTAWVYRSDEPRMPADYAIGIAGGGPGVSAGWESNGSDNVIVLCNLDPPCGERVAMEIGRAL